MTDSPEEEAALEADAKAYHADDLVKRLREVKDWWREPGRTAEQAADRIEQLEAALRNLITACDKGKMKPKIGVSGMTITANIKSSWINNVEAWAVEEARAALGEKKDD